MSEIDPWHSFLSANYYYSLCYKSAECPVPKLQANKMVTVMQRHSIMTLLADMALNSPDVVKLVALGWQPPMQ